MSEAFPNLTGRWLGRYDQDPPASSVAFEADLVEGGFTFTGQTREPNTFRSDMGEMLTASLTGGRSGSEVSFVKVYNGFTQGEDPVYEGVVNTKLTRITGYWSFSQYPNASGRFVMMRKPLASARTKTVAKQEEPLNAG